MKQGYIFIGHLGRSVPERDDFVSVRLDGDREGPAQTQVGYLEHGELRLGQIILHQKVLRGKVQCSAVQG